MSRSRQTLSDLRLSPRRAFTLVELLVVIAIVILLLALLVPTVGNVLASRRQTECANNLRQIGVGLETARQSGSPIVSTNWTTDLLPHIGSQHQLLFCADDNTAALASSYAMNSRAHRFGDMDGSRIVALDYRRTEATLVVDRLEDQDDWSAVEGLFAARHLQGLNVLLHSGTVQSYAPAEIDPRDCELWRRFWRPHQDGQIKLDICGDGATAPPEESVTEQAPPQQPREEYPPYDGTTCTETSPQTIDNADTEGFDKKKDDTPDHYGVETVEFMGVTMSFPYLIYRSDWKTIGEDNGLASWSWRLHDNTHLIAPGHQTDGTKAIYEFKVTPGNKYRVYAFWREEGAETYDPNEKYYPGSAQWFPYEHSDNTPIRIYDDNALIGWEYVNQKTGSSGQPFEYPGPDSASGYWIENWQAIGDEYEVTSDILRVTISADTGASVDEARTAYVVADAVRIECAETWPYHADGCHDSDPQIVTNGAAGFEATTGWTEASGPAVAVGGSGSETAAFQFTDIQPGQYQVWTYFEPSAGQATNAPFTVYAGDKSFSPVQVDQSKPYLGTDLDDDGQRWHLVGDYQVLADAGEVRVVISNNADGLVVADTVRLQCSYGSDSGNCNSGNPYSDRECRKRYADKYGATDDTEKAVASALNWLSRHQYEGGHWSFDHRNATCPYIVPPEPCDEQCNDGFGSNSANTVAATGMALLPFLGAGFGPTHGKYGDVVTAGINYLVDKVVVLEPGKELHWNAQVGRLSSGSYGGYEQGIGTLALAEALGICRQSGFGDVDEQRFTQAVIAAVRRIVACQSVESKHYQEIGGWRYSCQSSDDITVTGWMVQALLAARALGIEIDSFASEPGVFRRIDHYLGKATYGATTPDPVYGELGRDYYYVGHWGEGNGWGFGSQVGRFLRLATGTSPQAAAMQAAGDAEIERMASERGIGKDAYQAYYAHHFMRKLGGPRWDTWDEQMSSYLLEGIAPVDAGHKRGSWLRSEKSTVHSHTGRLWDTVSASLCLEAYYRFSSSL